MTDTQESAAPIEAPVQPQMVPRRRRAVLIVLWVVFALWVAALLAMYFGEVYPRRHPRGEGANVQRPTLDVQR